MITKPKVLPVGDDLGQLGLPCLVFYLGSNPWDHMGLEVLLEDRSGCCFTPDCPVRPAACLRAVRVHIQVKVDSTRNPKMDPTSNQTTKGWQGQGMAAGT